MKPSVLIFAGIFVALILAEAFFWVMPGASILANNSKLSFAKHSALQGRPLELPRYAQTLQLPFEPVLSLGGVGKKETVLCKNEMGWKTFLADRFGFNNPDSVWNKRKVPVILLGDSFTIGECTPPYQEFASLIRRSLSSPLLNLGYPASGPLLSLARLVEYGQEFAAKHIFYFYAEGNDLHDAYNESAYPLTNYLKAHYTQNLKRKSKDIERQLIQSSHPYLNEPTPLEALTLKRLRVNLSLALGRLRHSEKSSQDVPKDVAPFFQKVCGLGRSQSC